MLHTYVNINTNSDIHNIYYIQVVKIFKTDLTEFLADCSLHFYLAVVYCLHTHTYTLTFIYCTYVQVRYSYNLITV